MVNKEKEFNELLKQFQCELDQMDDLLEDDLWIELDEKIYQVVDNQIDQLYPVSRSDDPLADVMDVVENIFGKA